MLTGLVWEMEGGFGCGGDGWLWWFGLVWFGEGDCDGMVYVCDGQDVRDWQGERVKRGEYLN